MERWQGKVAVVTGASSGIGWAITRDLLGAGMHVVGLARRKERMLQARDALPSVEQRERFLPLACDLNSLADIRGAFERIEKQFDGQLHVLINNAGMAKLTQLLDAGNEAQLQQVIDVNLMGTVHCTKQAFRLMQRTLAMATATASTAATIEQCHVINVNSLLGHTVPPHIPACGFNLYPVAKHAVRACNEILRREFYAFDKARIRLSNISPGLTETEFGDSAGTSSTLPDFGGVFLKPEDVSRGICFILAAPVHVNVAELVMVPTLSSFNIPVQRSTTQPMAKWRGKRIIVAPVQFKAASDFILHLLLEGCKVIGLTNHLRRSETLRSTLPHDRMVNFSSQECDLHSMTSVRAAFTRIHEEFGEVHLFIFMLPKFSNDDYKNMYTRGYEMRLQQMLDVSLDSARMCLRQAENILFPPCCEKMCNSELMWIVRYNIALAQNVVEHLIERMSSKFYTTELCGKRKFSRSSKPENHGRYSWQLYMAAALTKSARNDSVEIE